MVRPRALMSLPLQEHGHPNRLPWHRLPRASCLHLLCTHGCCLPLTITWLALALVRAGSFKQRLLLKVGNIVAEHGASLALPVCLSAPAEYNSLLLSAAPNGDGHSSPQPLPEPQHAAA